MPEAAKTIDVATSCPACGTDLDVPVNPGRLLAGMHDGNSRRCNTKPAADSRRTALTIDGVEYPSVEGARRTSSAMRSLVNSFRAFRCLRCNRQPDSWNSATGSGFCSQGHSVDGLMTTNQVAQKFGVKPAVVRRWMRSGLLPGEKCGSQYRFDPQAVEGFQAPRTVTGSV